MLFLDAGTEWNNEESFSITSTIVAACWTRHWCFHNAHYCTLRKRVRSIASVMILNASDGVTSSSCKASIFFPLTTSDTYFSLLISETKEGPSCFLTFVIHIMAIITNKNNIN